jgi:uncharacterized membrane protein
LKLPASFDTRHRLSIAFGTTFIVAPLLPPGWGWPARMIMAWDVGVAIFLILVVLMLNRSNFQVIRDRAAIDDENSWRILLGVLLSIGMSLLAIIYMLKDAKNLVAGVLTCHLVLAVLTVVCSWLLTHIMFALHYAHDYYVLAMKRPDDPPCLRFPQEERPDYWDFIYFSFVIGMTSQVADVEINSRKFRQLCFIHSILSFFFNTVIVAMNINLLAGLV